MRGALALGSVLLTSCVASWRSGISDEEAISLIRTTEGYPKLLSTCVTGQQNSPLAREIARLVSEGFVSVPPTSYYLLPCTVHDKGKQIVERCSWSGFDGIGELCAFTHTLDVSRIVDKRTDSPNGLAAVIYEVKSTERPYLADLRKVDATTVDAAMGRRDALVKWDGRRIQSHFQRWEKGWRMVR